jgi:hypothetical protein
MQIIRRYAQCCCRICLVGKPSLYTLVTHGCATYRTVLLYVYGCLVFVSSKSGHAHHETKSACASCRIRLVTAPLELRKSGVLTLFGRQIMMAIPSSDTSDALTSVGNALGGVRDITTTHFGFAVRERSRSRSF